MLSHLTRLVTVLLQALHLRRSSPWEWPTPLDWLLTSPLQWLITLTYRLVLLPLRGRPFHPPRGRRPIRVVCLSDTHGQTIPPEKIPPGDLLIHCGDLTAHGTAREVQAQVDWLKGLSHPRKVVVGGNHDVWLDESVRAGMTDGEGVEVDFTGVEYLCDRMVKLEFEGGRRLNVYGWGAVPWCGEGFAFQYEREKDPWAWRIPDETDVLVTHTPPRHHLDLGIGCGSLLDEIWRVKPRLHVFGHAHWGHGKEAAYYDECQLAYESLMSMPAKGFFYDLIPSARWVEAFKVLFHGVHSILWKWIMLGPGTNHGGLMANASVMYGNTGKLRNPVTVVDL